MSVAPARPTTVPAETGRLAAGFGQLDAIGVIRHLACRESLALEGDAADHLHRVLSGTIAGYKATTDGRRQIIAFFFPGDVVGLTAGRRYAYGAEAVGRASVCSIPHARVRQLAEEAPAFRNELLAAMSREIAAAQERLLWIGRKTARERLACFLLECAAHSGRTGEDGRQFVPLPMSQCEIGDYLGLASETVSRTLAELARDGVIAIMRPFAGVAIRDRRRLERASDEGAAASYDAMTRLGS